MSSSEDFVVIGAGLMRTGTASLKEALERLLGGKCYHMKEVYNNPRHIYTWIKALDEGLAPEEWKHFLRNYNATTDVPGCVFYEELLKIYPNAKVILSVREPRAWVKSCQDTVVHVHAKHDGNQKSIFHWILRKISPMANFGRMVNGCISRALQCEFKDFDNEDLMVEKYNAWGEKVKSKVPSERLLIFNPSMGWEPLCQFLQVPIPDEPYPHINTTNDFRGQFRARKIITFLYSTIGAVVVGALAVFVYRRLV